jgi:hypothetical protein
MAAVNLALSYHPTSLEAKQLRADLLRSKCEYNQAIADYNAAIDSDKHNLNAYQGRAMAFAALGDSISAGYDLLKLDYLIEAEVFLKQEYDPHYDVIHGFVNNHTKHLQVLKTKLQPLAFEFVGYCSNRDQAAHIVELIKQNDGYDAVINNCNIPGIDLFSVTTRVSLLIASASEFTTWLTNLYNTHKSCGYRTVQWHFVYNLAARDIEKLPLVRLPLAVRPAIADYQHKYVEAWLAIQTGDINQAYFFLLQAKALGAGKDDVCNRALNDPVMAPLWSSLRNMVNTTIAADVVLAA